MKKIMGLLAGLLVMPLILTGCGSSIIPQTEEVEKDDTIEIGMSFDSFVIERWQKDRDVFVSTAQFYGAEVNVQNANGDVDKQIEQIEYFIDKGVDAIVIIPVVADKIGDTLNKAKENGIAVICYDRLVDDVDADLYISFDNFMVGEMMGEAVVGAGAQSVVMIAGPLTDNNVPMVNDSFTRIMKENNIDVVATENIVGWKAELAASYIYDNTSTIRQVDAIMCGNDDIATSVVRALSVCQLAGNIAVVGQDADLPACQHIVEGTQIMTVYKPVEKLASEAARLSVALANGEDIGVTETIQTGSHNVPYVAIEPIAVTQDNIDEVIIDGGFHSREDVYMNVAEAAKTEGLTTVE